ncbi:MAG TPA: hypothetical protein VER78_08250, partial [Thermoanaerobaculia bacterium]|nr:hypothetical protein [Thermoanaerobaculia bacterium]
MVARRWVPSGILAAAALVPAALWLLPALIARRAPSYRDQGDFFYPLKLYTADRLGSGQIPLWNPLSGLGEPWLANGQSGVFYPPTFLFLLPSPALAAGLFLLLHFAIGAWGAWRFLKQEAVSDAGALFGAAAFSACGFAASLSVYWNHFGGWAYLPAIASLARSGLRRSSTRLGLAALVGLQAMAGSPELAAGTLLLAALLAWEARPQPNGWVEPSRARRLLRLTGAAGLGLALAAWVILPMAELVLHSERRTVLPAAQRDFGSVGLTALSSALGLSEDSAGNAYLASLYAGPLVLFAACAAFAEKQRRRLALVLLAVAASGVVIAMSGPPGPWLRALPGLDRLRYPGKGLAWTYFALSMLAGLGVDSLRFVPVHKAILLAGTLAAVGLLAFSRQPPSVRATTALGLCGLVVLALGAGRATSLTRAGAALETAVALSLAASLFFSSRALLRFAPEAEIRRVPSSIPFLARIPGRVLTPPTEDLARWVLKDPRFDAATLERQREALLGYTNLLSGVSTVRTAAPLATEGAARIAASIDAVKDPPAAACPVSARLLWMPFQPARLGSARVGEFFRAPLNPYRMRLSFVQKYRVEPDAARAWERVAAGETDW